MGIIGNGARAFACGLVLLAGPPAQADDDAARELLARARAAVGGAAWDSVRSIHTVSVDTIDGAASAGEERVDLAGGRYVSRHEAFHGFPLTTGWDGSRYWEDQFGFRQYKPRGASEIDAAFRKCQGQWNRRCGASSVQLLGRREHAGAAYDVVRIVPAGGSAADYWINRGTGRIERLAYGGDVIDFADFRRVGALLVPFEERYSAPGRPGYTVTRLSRVVLDETMPDAVFAKPAERGIAALRDKPAGVEVPFEACGHHICVQLMLNQRGPFRFILDTGAWNTLSPATAARLGLRTHGEVKVLGFGGNPGQAGLANVDTVELEGLGAAGQTFVVAGLEGTGVDGLLGYQWLSQAVFRIDYVAHRLTFYDPPRFEYRGRAPLTPFEFEGAAPRVEGRLDGVAGQFLVDTGGYFGVTVGAPFARQFDLANKYQARERIESGSLSGAASALATRAGRFDFGGVSIRQPELQISLDQHNMLAAPGVAGNIGYGVLHKLNLVMDYARQRAYFEPNKFIDEP